MTEANTLAFEDIHEGMICESNYVISNRVYDAFMTAFDDRSPIHVDDGHARAKGFEGTVMHGGILSGFVSHFVGMRFPGANSLLLSTDLRFLKPSYLGDELRLEARVTHKLESEHVIMIEIAFHNSTRTWLAARGRVQIKLTAP